MGNTVWIQLAVVFGSIITLMLAVKVVLYFKKKNTNTEMWGTIFEGLTVNTIPQGPLKEPKVFIEKKAKRNGQDNDLPIPIKVN